MRLTQEMRRAILANLVAEHEVSKHARHVMDLTQQLAMDIVRSCMPQGVTTMAQLSDWRAEQIKAINASPFFGTHTYEDKVTYSVREDGSPGRVREAHFDVNFAGQQRSAMVTGDLWAYKQHSGYWDDKYTDTNSPHLGDIVPGYELELLNRVIGVVDGKRRPFYTPRSTPAFPEGHEFVKRQDEIDHLRRQVRAKYDELKGVVMATLSKYNSDTKLIEAWPEVAKYVPTVAKKSTAVAIDVKTLNAICGLPH